MMGERTDLVTMGSERFRTFVLEDFHVTDAWFPPGAVLESHIHDRATFAVMVEGSFDLWFPKRTYACAPATVFSEPRAERHANRIGRSGARVLIVQPDPDSTELLRPCRVVLERIHHFQHAGLAGLARRAIRELESPDALAPLAIEALALEMLAAGARMIMRDHANGAPPP